jgi:hypothetical protein
LRDCALDSSHARNQLMAMCVVYTLALDNVSLMQGYTLVSGTRSNFKASSHLYICTVAPASFQSKDTMAAVSMEQVLTIAESTTGKFAWSPSTTKIDGANFIIWNKWDKKAAELFYMNKIESINRNGARYTSVFKELITKRQLVCDELLAQALHVECEDEDPSPAKKRRKSIRKAKSTDEAMIPQVVEIQLGPVKTKDGTTLETATVTIGSKYLSSKNKILVHASKAVVEYLCAAVQGEWA